jgi:hypothetical protein
LLLGDLPPFWTTTSVGGANVTLRDRISLVESDLLLSRALRLSTRSELFLSFSPSRTSEVWRERVYPRSPVAIIFSSCSFSWRFNASWSPSMDLGMNSWPTNFIVTRFIPFQSHGAGKTRTADDDDVAVARRYRIDPANIASSANTILMES